MTNSFEHRGDGRYLVERKNQQAVIHINDAVLNLQYGRDIQKIQNQLGDTAFAPSQFVDVRATVQGALKSEGAIFTLELPPSLVAAILDLFLLQGETNLLMDIIFGEGWRERDRV